MTSAGVAAPTGRGPLVPASRTGTRVVLGIVAVIVVVGALTHLVSDGSATPERVRDQAAAAAIGAGDDASLSAGDELSGEWQDLRGVWEHGETTTRVVALRTGQIGVTAIEAGADGRIGVTLDPLRDTAGLAFRVADADNFWSVVPSAIVRSWVLVRVVDGRVRAVAATPALFGPVARVEVRLRGRTIDVWLNGRYIMGALDGHLQRQSLAGMAVRGQGSRGAGWADFTVASDV